MSRYHTQDPHVGSIILFKGVAMLADQKKGSTETSAIAKGKVKKQGSIRTKPAVKPVPAGRVKNIPDEFFPVEDTSVEDTSVEVITCPRCGDVIGPKQPLPHTLTRCNRCGIWVDNQGDRRIPQWRGGSKNNAR